MSGENSPSVAVVVLDTLRADAFEEHFEWVPGVRYDNAWSTSHWTVPAHASLFTGRYGSEVGVHGKSKNLDCPDATLAERLQDAGWTTRGYSNNVHVSQWFDFDRGFEEFHHDSFSDDADFNWAEFIFEHRGDGASRYLDLLRQIRESDAPVLPTLWQGACIKLKDFGVLPKTDDETGIEAVTDWAESIAWNEHEFLFVNLMEVHGPYEAPESYRTVEPTQQDGIWSVVTGEQDADADHLRAAYSDCARYLSDSYHDLYPQLAEAFDVVITLADHGEAFGEYGGWEHTPGLWPAVTHVPLVVDVTGDAPTPIETECPVSLMDVHETVCAYTGIKTGRETHGRSLLGDHFDADYHLLETHGMLEKALVRLRNENVSEQTLNAFDVELHAIAGQDGYSFETYTDGIVDHNGGVSDAASVIEQLAADLEARDVEGSSDVPDRVEENLKDLGYV
ncbi:sulfatase [Halolamina litorea]|uniref:Sulfatase-like hydrolase/transferase n=1 Tax=Halolamina litorea TaxID=1515593 RepID=A0ABD6BNG0_9EURY|nr:sulfatase-like hydrolase/transferase [Halolamina litorea]